LDESGLDELGNLRRRIDRIDRSLVDLLAERFHLAGEIGTAKRTEGQSVYDPNRERRVLAQAMAAAGDRFPPERLQAIFREIISASRSVESGHSVLVHGELGGLAHEAAYRRFGSAIEIEVVSRAEDLLRRVDERRVDFGLVTLEGRSFEASLDRLDLLLHTEVGISGEVHLQPRILAWSSAEQDEPDRASPIFATPAILARASRWLAAQTSEREVRATSSTEHAVRAAAEARGLVLGHPVLESIFPLRPVSTEVDDGREEWRRFFLLSRRQSEPTGRDKTTVLLFIPDRAGALHRVTGALSRHEVNLCWLEPKATALGPWDHLFVLEMEGHREDPRLRETLAELEGEVEMLRVLGSYADEGPRSPSAGAVRAGGAP